jgi:hypothetical protein
VVDSKGLVKRQVVDLYGSACGKSASWSSTGELLPAHRQSQQVGERC